MAVWMGGKARLAPRLIALFPEHRCYVEPFGGMASVLLNKPKAETEVYNDLDSRLVNLFRCAKYHGDELSAELDLLLKSRETFRDFKEQPGFTEIQRAARFLYCQSLGFGGVGEHFGTGVRSGGNSTRSMTAMKHTMARLAERLDTVIIEGEDWEQCLARYDSPETLFYCDPPYYKSEGYSLSFEEREHRVLAERLRGLKGKFLLTNSDSGFVRSLYRGLSMNTLVSQMGRSKDRQVVMRHLVVRNY